MKRKRNVLVIEDNPDEAFMMQRALTKCTVCIDPVLINNGQEAVRYLASSRRMAEMPQLILIDLKLPGMSGFDVVRQIRSAAATRFIPVIIFSSSELPADRLEAYSCGVNSFIRKPIRFADLTEQMELVTQYWLTLNRPVTASD